MSRKAWGCIPRTSIRAWRWMPAGSGHIDLVILTGPAGCGKTLLPWRRRWSW